MRSAVLITMDTTRWDAVGYHGVHPGISPHLDALASESVVYEAARTVTPLTLPSHASMLTGLYPPRHTVRDNGYRPLPRSAFTLAEAASERRMQTAAFVAATVMDEAFGLNQGFEVFEAPERPSKRSGALVPELTGSVIAEAATAWIRGRDKEQPFFLWVHLFDPHAPYAPPKEFLGGATGNNAYHGEIAYMDDAIGRVMDALREDGSLDETTVLVVADHGEGFGAHSENTHGHLVYDSTLKVPFLLRHPDGYRAGERSDELVSVVDVFPTLTDAMGLPGASNVDGYSLFRSEVPEDRGVYFEAFSGYIGFNWSPIAGWLDKDGKYIHSSQPEFYDLATDPGEESNRIDAEGTDVEPYLRAIALLIQERPLEIGEDEILDGGVSEMLRGLGYTATGPLAGGLPNPLQPNDLPSPAQVIQVYEQCQAALRLANLGNHAEAVRRFQAIVDRNPRNWFALEQLGRGLVNLKRHEEALPHLQLLVSEGPQRGSCYFNLGICLYNLRRYDEGIETMWKAHAMDPQEPHFLETLIVMLEGIDRHSETARVRALLEEL